jgi:hypothetical protein
VAPVPFRDALTIELVVKASFEGGTGRRGAAAVYNGTR